MANRIRMNKLLRAEKTPDEVLFIVGATRPEGDPPGTDVHTQMTDGERAIKKHLDELGYTVEAQTDASVEYWHVEGKSLILVSSTVEATLVNMMLRYTEVPVVVSHGALSEEMGMTGAVAGVHYGAAFCREAVTIANPRHLMAAGLTGEVALCEVAARGPLSQPVKEAVERAKENARRLSKISAERKIKAEGTVAEEAVEDENVLIWGLPAIDATRIAVLKSRKDRAVVFGYELCAKMVGLQAPARRVGLFLDQSIASQLTGAGWALFEAAVEWAIGDDAKQFMQVFNEEWREIRQRRSAYSEVPPEKNICQPPDNLVGLALSGGGIRSATFCLGLLQGLSELNLLHLFDYLSTVSGGGYLGGWWSAWLSRATPGRKGIFPQAEWIEPDRARGYLLVDQSKIAEGSMNAEKDPIHHLRLFANYLTPRKGLLSADTWRAIAAITRNLILTWLILLPILVAFVLAGQLYFALQKNSRNEFAFPYWSEMAKRRQELDDATKQLDFERAKKYQGDETAASRTEHDLLDKIQKNNALITGLREGHTQILLKRAKLAAWLIIPLAGWIVYMISIWLMRNTSGPRQLGWIGGTIVWLLLGAAIAVYKPDLIKWLWAVFKQSPILILGWLGVAALLWFYACRMGRRAKRSTGNGEESYRQVQINRIGRVHVRLLVILVVTTAVLALAGFGHELIEYVFQPDNPLVLQAGGWVALASAIGGSIFTAVKGSPMGGGDPRAAGTPSLTTRVILAITPPLVLIVLALAAAWLARWVFFYVTANYLQSIPPLTFASFVSVGLCLLFAIAEVKWRQALPTLRLAVVCGLIIILGVAAYLLVSHAIIIPIPRILPWAIIILTSSLILLRMFVDEMKNVVDGERRTFKFVVLKRQLRNYYLDERQLIRLGILLASLIIVGIAFLFSFAPKADPFLAGPIPANRLMLACAASTGLLLCVALTFFEVLMGMGQRRRSLWLLLVVYFVLTALLISTFYANYKLHSTVMLTQAAVGMLALVFGWVVAIGWMVDPNALSMHTFYKGRLVRAYLGASNPARREQATEITDAVEGDDIALRKLQNCQLGAPYHLINTTLNLVGGRDLATAQRSSAAFILSKRYCGSARTGYRKTEKYMYGHLSLGAAIAASGAAVSPNMGSLRTSASLAVLMSLLNVRLGYWAPTPNKDSWRSSKTRLWPFYMLRESLSQTNDLSTYCYLTDGGHFENTALYSLVERGCRFIVLSDNAADPAPCFADLGNAIRRCRIDFKTEINLDITPFAKKSNEDRFAAGHYAVGQIIYSEKHVKNLGWSDTSLKARTGVIVYIKPALLKEDKDLTADVRQYEIENEGFPQQTTIDQWFDEAQFESYRQLGYHCAKMTFGKVTAIDKMKEYTAAFGKQQEEKQLQPEEQITLDARNASDRLTNGQLLPEDIEKIFEFLDEYRSQST